MPRSIGQAAAFHTFGLDADHTKSTLDWFDKDFVLAVGDEVDEWIAAADQVSRQLNMPLIARRLTAECT